MKKVIFQSSLILLTFACKNSSENQSEVKNQNDKIEEPNSSSKKPLSPHKSEIEMVGDAQIQIDYSAPSVRGRIIFGGLLAYGEVWQAGAHNATWLETNKDIILSGNLLKAGKYGIFAIPNIESWTIIFNKNWEQHGKDEYDENDDVYRLVVKPEVSEVITEQLVYQVQKINEQEGIIKLSWEKVSVSFPFEIAD